MSDLPASIEAYLVDAGFSATELFVLKRLLQEDALTLRELATKTGKSTGVLDQAMKKLVSKGIVNKEVINGGPKFVLSSVQSILKWVEADMENKQLELRRRHADFESFLATVKVDRKRPEMKYFDGEDGIKAAYEELLELGKAEHETLHYFPITTSIEDDPLRDFRVQYFRKRRQKGMFARYIVHNDPLGRRFHTRDPFEYRQTVLVNPDQYPFTFEKVIAGNTIACFDHVKKTVCFVNFAEYAAAERAMFLKLWNKKTALKQTTSEQQISPTPPVTESVPAIPFQIRTLSGLRDFFLSRKSLGTFALLGLVAAGVTYGLYISNVHLNTQRIRERALAIAATGALQFDPADLNELRTEADISKPQYAKVIYKLNEIRRQNEDVKYIYIMRPTGDPDILEFVADADSLDPYAKKDLNGNGVIDDADLLSPPGQPYELQDHGEVAEMFATQKPIADREPYTDQWGTFLSGQAPIKDENGRVVAMIGVDIFADKAFELTSRTFTPTLWFIVLFLVLVFIRLAAFNRSLYKELWELLQMRKVVITIAIAGILSIGTTFALYRYSVGINTERIREKVISIAATGVLQFSPTEIAELRTIEDANKPVYGKIVDQLNAIRQQNKDIIYVYIVRPTEDPNTFAFVADADAKDPFAKIDTNNDGFVDDADTLGVPGLDYDVSDIDILRSGEYYVPIANHVPYSDKWGSFITGYAPIKNETGKPVAVLAVDVWADHVYDVNNKVFAPVYVFLIFLILFVLFRAPGFSNSLLQQILQRLRKKSILASLGISAVLAGLITLGIYQYTLNIIKEELGQRLMSIAVTAAPEIRGEDLEKIHTEEDMQTDEYQRIFRRLNDIRERNREIKYIYILRPTAEEGLWEFIVDADTNHYLPFLQWDYNNDGILNTADEAAPPGMKYNMAQSSPEINKFGLQKPTVETNFMTDQWGIFLTGSAPIQNIHSESVAVLAVDLEVNDLFNLVKRTSNPIKIFGVAYITVLLLTSILYRFLID